MKPRRITAFLAVILFHPSTLTAQPASILPPCRLETLTSTDGSSTLYFTIEGQAGFHYTIQESNDLITWRDVTSFHSLGHVHTHPLLTTSPPPAPDPTSPPAPPPPAPSEVHTAALLLQPAPGGGTLASWNSFQNGNPVTVRLEATLDAAWPLIPLYFQDHGNFHLLARQPTFPLTDPGPENPPLTGTDQLLLDTLGEHLPAMNAQVAQSLATSRKAPPPAPTDPRSRLFVRLKALTLDTDGDGIRDDIEYLLASQNHPLANPFNPDVDGNGNPDGNQTDSDNDTTPDALDIAPTDASDPGQILPIPRFALFPIFGGLPHLISDRGTVLFENATWRAGDLKPIRGTAVAINDHDQILTLDTHTFTYTDSNGKNQSTTQSVYHHSKSHGGSAQPVADTAGYHAAAYIPFDDERRGLLSNDGVFTAISARYGEDVKPDGHNAFRIRTNGTATRLTRPPEIFFALDDDLSWGYGSIIIRGHTTPGSPTVAIRDGTDETIIRALGTGGAYKYYNNRWQPDSRYDWAVDIAKDGTAIGHHNRITPGVPADLKLPLIHINGQWTPFDRAVPGAGGWVDDTSIFLDMSPSGWALLRHGEETLYYFDGQMFVDPDYPDMSTGVLMPVRLTGIAPAGGAPEATGVDDISVAAPDPGPAVDNKLWIMAPAGSGKTKLKIETNASEASPVKLSAPGIKFNNEPEATLTSPVTTLEVTATDPQKTGQEIMARIKLGTAESVSQPIALKIMKGRTVNLTVHPIGSYSYPLKQNDEGKSVPDLSSPKQLFSPVSLPTKAELETYLNKVYSPQLNAKFSVTIRPQKNLEWDIGQPVPYDRKLRIEEDFREEEELMICGDVDPDAHINVYFLGGATMFVGTKFRDLFLAHEAHGIARPDQNIAILTSGGFLKYGGNQTEKRLHTFAHEIGHCIIGKGHPDEKVAGPAPLTGLQPANRVKDRLMASGPATRLPGAGTQIVKGEWDVAEAWFREQERNNKPF